MMYLLARNQKIMAGILAVLSIFHGVTGEGGTVNTSTYDWQIEANYAVNNRLSLLQFKFSRAPHFNIAAEEWPPHVYIYDGASARSPDPRSSLIRGPISVSGPMGKLLDELARSMNFTYSLVKGDGYWGAPGEDGIWNGMIGTVLRKEADIGLGPFGMSYLRSQVVDFTTPVFIEMLHILVNRPQPEPDPWGFLVPFTWFIWVGLLLTLVAVILTSFTAVRILGFGGPRGIDKHILAFYSVAFSQEMKWKPNSLTLKVLVWLWLMVMLIVSRSYSGALTSLLAVKTVPIKYDSLRNVLDDRKLKLLLEGSTALTAHLQTVKDGIYYELAEAARARATYVRASEAQEAAYKYIPDGSYAMLIENVVCRKIYSDYFSKTGRCDFYMSTGNFWRLIYAMIVQKGSPLQELINARIHAITASGIYERWASVQMPNMTHCLKMSTKVSFQEPYNLQGLWALFLLFAGGMLLAAIAFGVETILPHILELWV